MPSDKSRDDARLILFAAHLRSCAKQSSFALHNYPTSPQRLRIALPATVQWVNIELDFELNVNPNVCPCWTMESSN